MAIKSRKNKSKNVIDIELGRPIEAKGNDGDITFNVTENGIGLFGKLYGEWYRFGIATKIGRKGRPDISRKIYRQDVLARNQYISK